MNVTDVEVEAISVDGAPALDRIHGFWVNVRPGEGYVTLICYGCAWTAYFGGMNGQTIQQFFVGAGVDYLVVKMGNTPTLKQGKKQDAYLGRIIKAVQDALKDKTTTAQSPPTQTDGPPAHAGGNQKEPTEERKS